MHSWLRRNFSRDAILWLSVILLPPCAFFAYTTISFFRPLPDPIPFSAACWKEVSSTSRDGEFLHYHMAKDLLAREGLRGLHRREVIELLGPPDRGAYLARATPPFADSYHLRSGLLPDDDWLVVRYDVYDFVVEASILTD